MSERPRYGQRECCHRCGHDIEWCGRKAGGWHDRGGGRTCLPFEKGGEVFMPVGVHAPKARAVKPKAILVWACVKCGSTECEYPVWATLNGDVVQDTYGTFGYEIWCPTCETHNTDCKKMTERRAAWIRKKGA